jgi:HAD superfamily hydrolase (TIGR01509 family)
MHFTTAIFDMDGTLFDSERIALDCWQAAFRDYGVHVPRKELEMVVGADGETTRAHLDRHRPADVGFDDLALHARSIRNDYVEQHGLSMKAGSAELLGLLRNRGVKIGLATSTYAERTRENLQKANIAAYFQVIVCGDQIERSKPYPDIYLKALKELQSDPEESIAIEDSDHGIMAAHAAGIRVIYVPDIKEIDAETRGCVHRQYTTLMELWAEIVS